MSVLKTCPFCGAKPIIDEWIDGDKKYYRVCCDDVYKCSMLPTTDYNVSKSVVVREWNRRAKDEHSNPGDEAAG